MGLQDLTDKEQLFKHAYEVSERGWRISRLRNISYMPTRYPGGAAGSHWEGTTVPTCIRGIRAGLQDLAGGEHQIEHAYIVSGRGCRISRVENYRSYMPTRHQEGTSGSHGLETPDRTCLLGVRTALHDLIGSEHKIIHAYKVSGRGCKISRIRNTKVTTKYQDGAAGSRGFGKPDQDGASGSHG